MVETKENRKEEIISVVEEKEGKVIVRLWELVMYGMIKDGQVVYLVDSSGRKVANECATISPGSGKGLLKYGEEELDMSNLAMKLLNKHDIPFTAPIAGTLFWQVESGETIRVLNEKLIQMKKDRRIKRFEKRIGKEVKDEIGANLISISEWRKTFPEYFLGFSEEITVECYDKKGKMVKIHKHYMHSNMPRLDGFKAVFDILDVTRGIV